MNKPVEEYIDRVIGCSGQKGEQAEELRDELRDHFDQKIGDLIDSGESSENATFEAIRLAGPPRQVGEQLRPLARWIDIRSHGMARGFIAVGPRAVGVFAFGGLPIGVVAIGGMPIGLLSFGGLALGLFLAIGGLSIGSIASGGFALGGIAIGGLAIGAIAKGGLGVGLLAPKMGSNEVVSRYTEETAPSWVQGLYSISGSVERVADIAASTLWMGSVIGALIYLVLVRSFKKKASTPREDDWLFG
ncbi:MAG: permease prefix domain 1-containing protein [Verrucomicrobiota bacterium]